jgi:hypothetical protein
MARHGEAVCSRWLKRQLGNVCCHDLADLRYELGLAIQRLRRRPQIIQACFHRAGLQLWRRINISGGVPCLPRKYLRDYQL